MTSRRWRFALLLALLGVIALRVAAQSGSLPPGDDPRYHPWQVFIDRDIDATGADRLTFIDTVSGETVSVTASGERYTPAGGAVLYYDPAAERVMLAEIDGTLRTHPFIQPNLETRRVDWAISGDGTTIAWTLTDATPDGQLTTTTSVAGLDGLNPRQVLVDGPRPDGIRALPLAFSSDKATLYMDLHPDGLGRFLPVDRYASLIALNLDTGQATTLPGEDRFSCFCGAAVGDGLFLRLVLAEDGQNYDLRNFNLRADTEQTIPAYNLRNFPEAGDLLIAPDGTRAVYALMQILNLGTPQQGTRTVFMLVDLANLTQEPLTANPITSLLRPVAWTEDNSAVLLVSADPEREGTWKVGLDDRRLERVADLSYVGTLRSPAYAVGP